MGTKLTKTVKRELTIRGATYTLTISPDSVRFTRKGFRKGLMIPFGILSHALEAPKKSVLQEIGAVRE